MHLCAHTNRLGLAREWKSFHINTKGVRSDTVPLKTKNMPHAELNTLLIVSSCVPCLCPVHRNGKSSSFFTPCLIYQLIRKLLPSIAWLLPVLLRYTCLPLSCQNRSICVWQPSLTVSFEPLMSLLVDLLWSQFW